MRTRAEQLREKSRQPHIHGQSLAIVFAIALLFVPPLRLTAQAAPAQGPAAQLPNSGARLEFEVASVRQNKSDNKPHSNIPLDSGNVYSTVNKGDDVVPGGGYFSATNLPLVRYIVFAYKLSGTQELALRFNFFPALSSNVPAWVKDEHFDIEARAEGSPTKDQMRLMMQALLADRFKLVVHQETRQAPVFALVLAKPGKTGPRLQPHPADDSCSAAPSSEHSPALRLLRQRPPQGSQSSVAS